MKRSEKDSPRQYCVLRTTVGKPRSPARGWDTQEKGEELQRLEDMFEEGGKGGQCGWPEQRRKSEEGRQEGRSDHSESGRADRDVDVIFLKIYF